MNQLVEALTTNKKTFQITHVCTLFCLVLREELNAVKISDTLFEFDGQNLKKPWKIRFLAHFRRFLGKIAILIFVIF